MWGNAQHTDEQLQQAWQQHRREDWPATFEEAMAHPMYSRLVRLHAALGLVQRREVQRPEPPLPAEPDAPPAWPYRSVHARTQRRTTDPQPQQLDRKRLASGERDED